jgi:hypothetical protein
MPQLDKITYFTQFMWLCFFFGSFYLILVKHYLPRIARGLYVRAALIKGENKGTYDVLLQETKIASHSSLEITTQALSLANNVLFEGLANSNKWRTSRLQSTAIVDDKTTTGSAPLSSFQNADTSMRVFHKEHLLSITALNCALSPSGAHIAFPKLSALPARSKYFQIVFVRKLLKR